MATQLEVAQAKKIERLKLQILKYEAVMHAQNVKLDALHWVWCSGGCQGGTQRWVPGELTEEKLQIAESAVKRMRESYTNRQLRKGIRKTESVSHEVVSEGT